MDGEGQTTAIIINLKMSGVFLMVRFICMFLLLLEWKGESFYFACLLCVCCALLTTDDCWRRAYRHHQRFMSISQVAAICTMRHLVSISTRICQIRMKDVSCTFWNYYACRPAICSCFRLFVCFIWCWVWFTVSPIYCWLRKYVRPTEVGHNLFVFFFRPRTCISIFVPHRHTSQKTLPIKNSWRRSHLQRY